MSTPTDSTVTYYKSFEALAAAMAPDTPRPRLRPATEYPAAEVDWLWQDKIPVGKVTLLMGDPGLGKSLIAIDTAARITRGQAFPATSTFASSATTNQTKPAPTPETLNPEPQTLNPPNSPPPAPGSVLILSAEDQIADTIRPRLDAAGADPAKIFFASEITDLRRDLGLLAQMLDDAPDCRLIIVDPVNAYVGPSDSHFHTIVRRVLKPLAELAAARKIAILAVTHLRKTAGAAITRATGSMGFAAAARCVWTVVPDADDPTRNLLLPVKNNLGPKEAGLAFSIEKNRGDCAPTIYWHESPVGTPSKEAAAAKRGPAAEDRQHAAHWLELALAAGPRECYEIMREGKSNGFHPRTLQRALHLVGGFTRKNDFLGGWLWSLNPSNSETSVTQQNVGGVSDADSAPLAQHTQAAPEVATKHENSPSPQSRAPNPQSPASSPQPPKNPVAFAKTCRLREKHDELSDHHLSPSRIPPTICELPPYSVAESIRYLNNLDKHRKPPDQHCTTTAPVGGVSDADNARPRQNRNPGNPESRSETALTFSKCKAPPDSDKDEDPNSPTGHPILDQLLAEFRQPLTTDHGQRTTPTKKSARSHSRFPTGTDSWHFTRPADSCEPGAMHPSGVSAQALDVSSTRRHEDAI